MIKTEEYPVTEGIRFRSIPDTRFKTLRIAVNFMLPLEKETAAAHALLPFLLSRASREYPDFTRLNERLSELYGAAIHADVRKLGEAQVLSVAVAGLADRYALEGESISAELSHLLCSILFDPPLVDGLFPEDGFEQEKRQTIEMIDSDFNDKRTFARLRCEELMCDREAFGINRYGSREDVTALRREEMTKVWERVLRTARIEIMALGDCDPVKPSTALLCRSCIRKSSRKWQSRANLPIQWRLPSPNWFWGSAPEPPFRRMRWLPPS